MSARLKIALAISLILNIFLVGLGIGVVVTGARITPAAQAAKQRPQTPPIWAAAERLPPEERAKFRQILRTKAAEVQPELKSVRQARRQAAAMISETNYDPKVVAAMLQQAREGEMHARSEIDATFVDYLSHLTPDQRRAMAGVMMRSRPNALQRLDGQQNPDPDQAPAANP